MKSIKIAFTLMIVLGLLQFVMAQEVTSYEFIEEISGATIADDYGISVAIDIELYKVSYSTVDPFGEDDIASGLLIVPKDKTYKYPMLSYSHGTVKDRNTAMSNLVAADVTLAIIYASFGFVVVAPDYLGMTDSRGFHPYVHAATEASASIDMLLATKAFALPELGVHLNNRLFITGYSQGGHAAMATHRELEKNYEGEFEIALSAPMSGPYSLSEKMIDFTLGDQPYSFLSYLPNVALSYKYVYPDLFANIEMEDIFKPAYVDDINKFRNDEMDLFELNDRLTSKLIIEVGAPIPKFMLLENTLDALLNDPTHPLSVALADNDVYDWAPKAKTKLYYCKGDDQVFYENSTLAEEVMIANGAVDVVSINLSDIEDHGGCVSPALFAALGDFFFIRNITSGNKELALGDLNVRPNPFDNNIIIEGLSSLLTTESLLSIYDVRGEIVYSKKINNSSVKIDLGDLHSGFYYLEIVNKESRLVQKLIKN